MCSLIRMLRFPWKENFELLLNLKTIINKNQKVYMYFNLNLFGRFATGSSA
jgi:hypothetical protein